MKSEDGYTCSICASTRSTIHYRGLIRAGKFGFVTKRKHSVRRCIECGADGLVSDSIDYSTDEYRISVDGEADASSYYHVHDRDQAAKLSLIGIDQLRGKRIVDVGSGAGSFLDVAKGVADSTRAVEPNNRFRPILTAKGHECIPDISEMPSSWTGDADLVVLLSVIEHVEDPLGLLEGIRRLLAPGGSLLLSTPNRNDWLLELLPDDYAQFFYRVVHRWYFDADSLEMLGNRAGLQRSGTVYVQRFGLSNTLAWMRDRRPTGHDAIRVDEVADAAYRTSLERSGRADYLYMWLSLPTESAC